MKRRKRSAPALLLVLMLLVSFVIPSGVANAASDYDDLLHASPTLYVYTDGNAKTQKMDISTTWWAEFQQTYAKRLAQNIGWPNNFVTEFEAIKAAGGSWGVYTYEDANGINVSIVATRDPNAYCGFVGSANEGVYRCASNAGYGFIRAEYFTHNSFGGNGCMGSYGDRCSDTGMNVYAEPTMITGTAGYNLLYFPNSVLSNFKFFFLNFDLTYPAGYGGEQIPVAPPAPTYVAMGDSFSSGEGNAPFEAGTNQNGVNECHRSPRAYPRLSQQELNLGATAFVACSGATTANVLYGGNAEGSWGALSQINALSGDTKIVTISIGGNDVAFESYALGCVVACGPGTPLYAAMMAGIGEAFKENLKTTYETILSKAPEADVYVLDYPHMSSNETPACGPFDLSGARDVQLLLNATISNAVLEVDDPRLHFVPTNYPGSPFEGRHLCTDDPRGSAFSLLNMHPNADGQEAYKEVIAAYLN